MNESPVHGRYRTIASKVEAMHKVSGSKHMAFVYPVAGEEDIKGKIAALRQEFHDATHVCFAWRLGPGEGQSRFSDDGEPSGTAGRPILGQLLSFDVTNVLACVVRYFGGTKLGTGGLADAYKTAVKMALESANVIEYRVTHPWMISFPFELQGKVMQWQKANALNKLRMEMGTTCILEVEIGVEDEEAVLGQLEALYPATAQRIAQGSTSQE